MCPSVTTSTAGTLWPMIMKLCMRNLLIIWKISTEKNFGKSKKKFWRFFFFQKFFLIFFWFFSKFFFQIFFRFFFKFFFIAPNFLAEREWWGRAKRTVRRRPRCRSRRLRQQRVLSNFQSMCVIVNSEVDKNGEL